MATFSCSALKAASAAHRNLDAETKFASAPQREVTCLVQIPFISANSLTNGFCKKLFNKLDAETSYLGGTSVKIHLPLHGELWNQISLWRGGEISQSASLHSRDNISCMSHDQEQEQSRPLQLIVNSKPLLFSCRKYCCTLSAYLTSSVQIEVAFQD